MIRRVIEGIRTDIAETIGISKDILKAADQHLHKVLSTVIAESIVYSVPGEGEDSEPTQMTVEGRDKMAVCEVTGIVGTNTQN